MYDTHPHQTQSRSALQVIRDTIKRWGEQLPARADVPSHRDDNDQPFSSLVEPGRPPLSSDAVSDGHRGSNRWSPRAEHPQPPLPNAAKLVEPTDLALIPPLDFVVGAPFHIARGTVSTLFGLGGVGKSSLAVALGAHIALGKDFLGATTAKGRVFYGEFEGAGQLLARATRKVFAALEEDSPGSAKRLERDFKQKHYTAQEKASWDYARGMVPALIQQLGRNYDVVFFDSYEAATMSDSNDSQAAAELMMLFARLAVETNTAVILIDHAPKHNKASVFGSTKKTDFARVVVNIEAAEAAGSNMLNLHSAKCNVAPKPTFPRVERLETEGTLRFIPVTGFAVDLSGVTEKAVGRLEHLIREARGNGAATRMAVYDYVHVAEELASPEAARKRVARARLQHLLPESQSGRRR